MAGASKANQRQGRTRKRQYDKYKAEAKYQKNKCRKLLKHLKVFVGDKVAKAALVLHGKVLGKDYS